MLQWDAWDAVAKRLSSSDDAKKEYIALVKKYDPAFVTHYDKEESLSASVRDLLETNTEEKEETEEAKGSNDVPPELTPVKASTTVASTTSNSTTPAATPKPEGVRIHFHFMTHFTSVYFKAIFAQWPFTTQALTQSPPYSSPSPLARP